MGLYKLCGHQGRARDRCEHAWWGSFRGKRVSLSKWTNRPLANKEQANAALGELQSAIRERRFNPDGLQPLVVAQPVTFNSFANIYIERYVKSNGLASADTIDYRMAALREHFGTKILSEIRTADVEDFVAKLKAPAILNSNHKVPRVRRPATINRYLSLLRHMFNWAVGREYLERTPFRRGSQALIKQELEDNRRHRRLTAEEEKALLAAAPDHLKALIVLALDAGLRRGEMLALTWADVEVRPGWLRLRGDTTKSGKTRFVPISTKRLKGVLEFLRLDVAGAKKKADSRVCSSSVGEPVKFFRSAWVMTVLKANGVKPEWKPKSKVRTFTAACLAEYKRLDLRWHDLRHEYASRLVEKGTPLSQVRDLLGHASIVTTERYDNQREDALAAAVKQLETGQTWEEIHPAPAPEAGETFKVLSRSDSDVPQTDTPAFDDNDAKLLQELEKEGGVGNGVRTRDFRSHSPALYR
jgi:integrase